MTRSYYVSITHDELVFLLAGPFETHAEALAMVDRARQIANEIDPGSRFDTFGTTAEPSGELRGVLNARLGMTA